MPTDQQTSQLIDMIFSLSRIMKERMSVHSDIANLSMLQMQAFIYVKKHPQAQMSEIALHFKIELPSATSLIDKLNKAGLVERQADENDRRVVRIALTAKGKELFAEAMKERTLKMETVLSYLSEPDKLDLMRIIKKLLQKLEEKS